MQRNAVEQALRFGPNRPEAHMRAAQYYFSNGEKTRALKQVELARSIDPEHWLVRMALVSELRKAGRLEEAIPLFRREVQRDLLNLVLPGPGRPREFSDRIALLQILLGDFRDAATSIESMPVGVIRSKLLALNQHALGFEAESDAALAQLIALDGTPWGAFHAAAVRACRGEGASSPGRLKRIDSGALQVMLRCSYGLGIDEDHARVGG